MADQPDTAAEPFATAAPRTPEDVIFEALVWAGGKGARAIAPRFPEVYERRAEVIAEALREAGMLNG